MLIWAASNTAQKEPRPPQTSSLASLQRSRAWESRHGRRIGLSSRMLSSKGGWSCRGSLWGFWRLEAIHCTAAGWGVVKLKAERARGEGAHCSDFKRLGRKHSAFTSAFMKKKQCSSDRLSFMLIKNVQGVVGGSLGHAIGGMEYFRVILSPLHAVPKMKCHCCCQFSRSRSHGTYPSSPDLRPIQCCHSGSMSRDAHLSLP